MNVLPRDLQQIVAEMVHELNFSDVMKELRLVDMVTVTELASCFYFCSHGACMIRALKRKVLLPIYHSKHLHEDIQSKMNGYFFPKDFGWGGFGTAELFGTEEFAGTYRDNVARR